MGPLADFPPKLFQSQHALLRYEALVISSMNLTL